MKITMYIFILYFVYLSGRYIDKNTVELSTDVTSYSMESVYKSYLEALIESLMGLKNSINGISGSSKSMYTIIDEILNGTSSTTSTEVDIRLSNHDGSWKVELTDEFINAILGDREKAEKNIDFALKQAGIPSIDGEIDNLLKQLDSFSGGIY